MLKYFQLLFLFPIILRHLRLLFFTSPQQVMSFNNLTITKSALYPIELRGLQNQALTFRFCIRQNIKALSLQFVLSKLLTLDKILQRLVFQHLHLALQVTASYFF